MQTVHVRVNDAATGQPTPVRIRFTDVGGTYYAPFGRLPEFAPEFGVDVGGNLLLESRPYSYIDGTCEVRLPAGVPLTVEISKGPEYRPVASEFTLPPGKLALRFEVERWIDLRADRWYSGDIKSYFLTPHAALMEAAAEDVAVVNLLAEESLVWGDGGRQWPAISNILAFSGQRPAQEMPGHLVVVNTRNSHPRLGRLLLLNCHRVVYPLAFGGPQGFDNWTLAAWCDQCHRKGGLVVGDGYLGYSPDPSPGELLADLILGKIDALDIGDFENPEVDARLQQESVLKGWYALLDGGFRVPVVAGSGKDDNLSALGYPRTYAHLEDSQSFNYASWIEAVRAGRTFVTNGPLLLFTANGRHPGSVLDLPAASPKVNIWAQVRSGVSFDRLEVLTSSGVVGSATATGSPASAQVEAEVTMPEGGWLLARCWGKYDPRIEQWTAAVTSPIYLRVDGRAPRPNRTVLAALMKHLEQMLRWVQYEARCETAKQRQDLLDIFEQARQELLRRQAQ